MGVNKFGSESVVYEGIGGTKKWEQIESYGPKFVENIVQAISRDILAYAMRTLSHCFICAMCMMNSLLNAARMYLLMLSVSRWEELHRGFRDFFFVQTDTNVIFKKRLI